MPDRQRFSAQDALAVGYELGRVERPERAVIDRAQLVIRQFVTETVDLRRDLLNRLEAQDHAVEDIIVPRSFVESVLYSGAFEGEDLDKLHAQAEALLNGD